MKKSLALLMLTALLAAMEGEATNYTMDGKTTYCYIINQSMREDRMDRTKLVQQGEREQCPLEIELKMNTNGNSNRLLPNQVVTFTWTVTHVVRANIMNISEDIPMVNQKQVPTQIPHSNLHYCDWNNNCDVFNSFNSTDQQYANFSGDVGLFNDQLSFPKGGQYTVFAHIVLAPKDGDYNSSQYDFAAFLPVTVVSLDGGKNSNASKSGDSGSSGMSTGTVVLIILCGVIVVLIIVGTVIFYRKKQASQEPDVFANSGFMPNASTAKGSNPHGAMAGLAGNGDMNGNGMYGDDLTYPWKDNGYQRSVHSNHSGRSGRSGASRNNTGQYQRNPSNMNQHTISSSGSFRGADSVNGDNSGQYGAYNPNNSGQYGAYNANNSGQYGAYGVGAGVGPNPAGPYDPYGMYEVYNTPLSMRNPDADVHFGAQGMGMPGMAPGMGMGMNNMNMGMDMGMAPGMGMPPGSIMNMPQGMEIAPGMMNNMPMGMNPSMNMPPQGSTMPTDVGTPQKVVEDQTLKAKDSKGPSNGAIAAGIAAGAAVGVAAGAIAVSAMQDKSDKQKNLEPSSSKSIGMLEEADNEECTRSFGTEDYASSTSFHIDDDNLQSMRSDVSSLNDYSANPIMPLRTRMDSSDTDVSATSSTLSHDLTSSDYFKPPHLRSQAIDETGEPEQESALVRELNDALEGRGSDASDGTVDFTNGSSRGFSAFQVDQLKAAVGRRRHSGNSEGSMGVVSERSDEENYEF